MEVERKNSGVSYKEYPLFLGEKSRKRENKIPTPPRNLREIDEGVGLYYDRIYFPCF